jgi:hypothetical protein
MLFVATAKGTLSGFFTADFSLAKLKSRLYFTGAQSPQRNLLKNLGELGGYSPGCTCRGLGGSIFSPGCDALRRNR